MARARQSWPAAAWALGDVESMVTRWPRPGSEPDRPIYVTGLARAGTTVLTEILAACPETATHRYSDRALPHAALFWRRAQQLLSSAPETVQERAHGDGLQVSRASPEAAEEPLWRDAFAHAAVDAETINRAPAFAAFYRRHVEKVIYGDGGHRYLAKNNELVGRLGGIRQLFRDPRVVVVMKNPIAQVDSLIRQHARFAAWAQEDPRLAKHLEALGHTEFGPQRRAPVAADPATACQIEDAWARGDEALGWALAWRAVYAPALAAARARPDHVALVRHEDLIDEPAQTLDSLLRWLGIERQQRPQLAPACARLADHRPRPVSLSSAQQRTVRAYTEDIETDVASWLVSDRTYNESDGEPGRLWITVPKPRI